jgi:hypothetical protein
MGDSSAVAPADSPPPSAPAPAANAVQPTSVTAKTTVSSGRDAVEVTWEVPPNAPQEQRYEVTALPTKSVWPPDEDGVNRCTLLGLERRVEYRFAVRAYLGSDLPRPAGDPSPSSVSNPVTLPDAAVSKVWRWISEAACVLWAIAAIVFGAIWASTGDGRRWGALTVAALVLLLGFVLLTVVGGNLGVLSAVVGEDRRISTSKVQVALWTVLIAFALAYLGYQAAVYGTNAFRGWDLNQSATGELWGDYLILLGGPFAALVFAKGIVSAKVESNKLQKTIEDDGTTQLRQALTGDNNAPDLVDNQYLLFNLVAFAYVLATFAVHGRLPAIPAILLALTSPAAATYVVNKAVASNAPSANAVTPLRAAPGDMVVIEGDNFMPAGALRIPTVTIGGTQAYVKGSATNTRLEVTIAPDTPTGIAEILVTTAARLTTQGKTMQITAA